MVSLSPPRLDENQQSQDTGNKTELRSNVKKGNVMPLQSTGKHLEAIADQS
jgi:hypothetical protein